MAHTVNIRSIEHVTHDVLRIATDKPSGYSYLPGQAADISLPQAGWENELRAFTFTSLPTDDFLSFMKAVIEHDSGNPRFKLRFTLKLRQIFIRIYKGVLHQVLCIFVVVIIGTP